MKGNCVFKKVDCIQVYVPDLQEGLKFYREVLGLSIIWKSDNAIGLGMEDNITEVVIQNQRKSQEIDFKVESVIETVEIIKNAGGHIVNGPFDIQIGKCAVVRDPWENEYVILDSTKGVYITDGEGNILGQSVN